MGWQDIVIVAVIVLLLLGGRWTSELGDEVDQSLRRFKGNGPG